MNILNNSYFSQKRLKRFRKLEHIYLFHTNNKEQKDKILKELLELQETFRKTDEEKLLELLAYFA